MEGPIMYAVMIVFGLLGHFLGKLAELRRSNPKLTLARYVDRNPYQIALSVVGAAAGGIALHAMGELTLVGALGVGYTADSLIDKLSSRTQAALRV